MKLLYNEAEKFIKEKFYRDSYDMDCTFHLQNFIEKKLEEDNIQKDPEYYDNRKGVVHVSSLAKCLRGVAYEMLGEVPTEKIEARKLGVFKAGNLFEEFIVDSLGDKMLDRQTEYSFKYKSITLVGRDDGTFLDEKGNRRVLEAKSVHSDSFWYREKEGTLVAYQNQIQIQTYLWLRRVLMNDPIDGYFSYISKDDCMIKGVPIKFNQDFVEYIILPALEYLNEAYEKQDPNVCPVPEPIVFNETKGQWQKNWLASYCQFHNKCAGEAWLLEATKDVATKNKEIKEAEKTAKKKEKVETLPEETKTDE